MLLELAQHLDGRPQEADLREALAAKQVQTTEHLVNLAEQELRRRKVRAKYLPREYFGEGAWAMLLDLFVCQHRNRKVSTTSVCLASDVPETTALRWLEVLEKDGLIVRRPDKQDRRVKHVTLSDKGCAAVRDILRSYPK